MYLVEYLVGCDDEEARGGEDRLGDRDGDGESSGVGIEYLGTGAGAGASGGGKS